MSKFAKTQIIKNVGSSWISLGLNTIVGIFLSPFILHRLGDSAFGLWVLIYSLTGYYGLFDLGIRSSIVRYVAKYSATHEYGELNRLINTAMCCYAVIGAICFVITLVGVRYLDSWFNLPPHLLVSARWLFLMVGGAVSLGFPLGVFGGILEGLQRFYLMNLNRTISTLTRAILIVIALRHGEGLLTVAFLTVVPPLFTAAMNGMIVMHLLPLHFGRSNVDRTSLRRIASYSGTTFMIAIADPLRFKTDAVVIGTFLSSVAITYFSIASRVVDYAGDVVSGLGQIFVSMSSHFDATGDLPSLRKVLINGNRSCALVIFPIATILIVLGKSVIETWVGVRYVAAAYPVLLVLLIPGTIMLAQSASPGILWGMAKHRTLAYIVLSEGVVNLVLSIILVRRLGIIGSAWGTAIPQICVNVLFLPQHLCRIFKISVWTYLRDAFTLPLGLCFPLVLTLLLLQRWFVPHTYFQLGFQLSIAASVYGLCLLWAIKTKQI
jgi:O-antigen/teichoic acid export membrane protein